MTTPPPRTMAFAAAALVVAGVLVAGVVNDVQLQMRLHHNRSQVAAATSLADRTAADIAGAGRSLTRSHAGRRATEKSLTEVTTELAAAQKQLEQAKTGVAVGAVAIGDVHSCAGGVNRSADSLQEGDQARAVAELTAVAPVCENILGVQAGGPVYPFDFADPDVLVTKGGTYFAYGTNSTAGNIQIMESTDLQHWAKAGDALPTLASWARPGFTWAPSVVALRRTYVLYYTVLMAGTRTQCISVATARRPQGPFVDSSKAPLECQPSLGGSIDPSPYVDPSGQEYLVWKSNGGDGQPATIWAQALDHQGTALKGSGPTALLRPNQSWEGSVVEAPSMVAVDGHDYLFYSGNNWDTADYAIGDARCTTVLGPCAPTQSGPLFASQSDLEGPGGETVFTDDSGQLEMAFQAWLPGAVGYPHTRLLFVRPLTVTGGTARVGQPD